MKKLIEDKKLLFGIVIGLIISVSITGIAAYSIYANAITYDNTTSKIASTNVNDAIDELYLKIKYKIIDSNTIDFSTIKINTAKTVLASSKGVCINRNNRLNCFKLNNWDIEKEHLQQVFSDISCEIDSSFVFCNASDFDCGGSADGGVYCGDVPEDSYCEVTSNGSAGCE